MTQENPDKSSLQHDAEIREAKALISKAQYNVALNRLEALINEHPKSIDGLYCLAICQRKLGNDKQALATLNSLLEIDRGYGHAYQERGHVFATSGDTPRAIKAFEKAVSINPALHASWRWLASVPGYARADEAKRHLDRLSSLPPELVSVASLISQNKLHKAELLCRQFLQKHRDHPEAMRLLAELGSKFQILDDAEVLLEACLKSNPDFLHARLDYVEVLHRRQKFHKALEQAKVLVGHDENNPGFQISLGNALQATGDYQAATQIYSSVLGKNNNLYTVHLALGHTLKTSGKPEEAVKAYQEAYKAKADFGDAYWSLANLKTYQFSDQEIASMRSMLRDNDLESDDHVHLCFALGKAFEDLGEFADSFQYYQQGNTLKASLNRYDAKRVKNELAYQQEFFDAGFFEAFERQRKGVVCDDASPIFIVGLPRAGSTLLEQILASHTKVDGTMELANIIGMAHRFNGRSAAHETPRYPAILEKLSADDARKLGERYIEETRGHRQGAPFFIDKMPNNFRHIALIQLILPNAKIVDARREPLACCFSGYKQLFAEGQEFSYDLNDIGEYYRQYQAVMAHWDLALPGKVLRVQHEDVINDLEGQVRRILDYCGLEFEQACVDFHNTKRAVRTPSAEQVRQPIYKSGMDQWRNFEEYLGPLKTALAL